MTFHIFFASFGLSSKLADGTYPLMHDKGHIGGLFKGLFGYNGDPSIIELIFWLSMVTGLSYSWRKFATKY